MMKIKNIDLVTLAEEELFLVNGGDAFTYDLGDAIGRIGGTIWNGLKSFAQAQERELSGIGGPTARHS